MAVVYGIVKIVLSHQEQSGTVSDCTYFADAEAGDTCSSIANDWGITLQEFITYNPSVQSDCTDLVVGDSYCVEENYGNGPRTTSTSMITTTKTSKTSTPAGPSPTQSGVVANCTSFYDVQSGDSCSSIVDMYGTFTLMDFYSWNPAVGNNCQKLYAAYYVCVGVPGTPTSRPTSTATPTPTGPSPTQSGIISSCTKYYQAVSGDSCSSIVDQFGTFSLADFEKWNPAVGSDCRQLLSGDYYCVAVPGTPTSRPTSTQSPTPTGPTPTQSGIIASCTKYYQAMTGDSCSIIVDKFGTFSLAQFENWNPAVGSDCRQLLSGDYYCIAVPGTPSSRTSTTASPTPTASGPQPQQPGIVKDCNRFYLVQSGQGCYDIEQSQGVSSTNFFKWNTGIKTDCSNLFSGYYVCTGIS